MYYSDRVHEKSMSWLGTTECASGNFFFLLCALEPLLHWQVMVTDQGGLTFTQGFIIVIVSTPLPPGVSSKTMAIAENSIAGALVSARTAS